MYEVTITNNNITQHIHMDGTIRDGRKLPEAKIEDAKNSISSFNFKIYPDNAGYNELFPFATLVRVYNTDRERYDFVGRVLQINPAMDSDGSIYKAVICESRMAYLCDTIQPYTEERQYSGDLARNGLQEFIDVILNNHNVQVPSEKQIYRGNVTLQTFETSEGVYKGLNYETTWDALIGKLVNVFGGEIRIRETDGVLYLDYAETLGTLRNTVIEVGRNMESASRSIDSTSIITRLIPLGAKQTVEELDDEGNLVDRETENRLTIASVNDDVIYIEDTTASALYGHIYGTVIFDDVTLAANLKTKGEAYLTAHNMITESNSVNAIDLSMLGLDVDDFIIYDRYRVVNGLIGLDATQEIIKKSTNIIEPYASSFTMGDVSVSLADSIAQVSGEYREIQGEIRRTVDTAVKNQTTTTYNIVSKVLESSLEASESSIMAKVSEETVAKSDYETFSETVRNILSMDADGTTMIFQTINEAIAEVNGRSESNYNEILKYIRFTDGDIILGETGNLLTLTISNDRISFKQNGVEVAYLSDNNLYIGNAVIRSGGRLQLGNFAFVPREDGSLSFLKVSG